jgi:hypothetical protein
MFGEMLRKVFLVLGFKKAAPVHPSTASEKDDFVAHHGLSYGEAADPISREAHFEVERLKSIKPPRR